MLAVPLWVPDPPPRGDGQGLGERSERPLRTVLHLSHPEALYVGSRGKNFEVGTAVHDARPAHGASLVVTSDQPMTHGRTANLGEGSRQRRGERRRSTLGCRQTGRPRTSQRALCVIIGLGLVDHQ